MKGSPEVERVKFRCREDLKFLSKGILGYKDWSVEEGLHTSIARHLRNGSKYKLFLMPRDHLKSSIITKGGALMRMLKNPDIRILLANNTWDNARKFLRSIQSYLSWGQILPMYFGRFEGGGPWTSDEITIRQRKVVNDAPTIATTGLEKEQTSQHYDLIIADDLVARENVQTADQRRKVKEYINSLMALLEPEGEFWVVGTRWSEDDAYGDLIEEGIWDPLIRTCWKDEGRTIPLFPEKFTKEKLDFLRKKLGPYMFSSWYLNDPVSPEAADFKREWVRYYQPGSKIPGQLYLTVDPAHSLSRDADFSGCLVAGMGSDKIIKVVDYVRKKVVPSDLIDIIFNLVKKWNLNRIGVETFAFQKTLKYEIQRVQRERRIWFTIDEFGRSKTGKGEPYLSKEARIRRLQPLFEQGLIELRGDMTELVDELLSFPRGKRDDLLDCLSYQMDYLVPSPGEFVRQAEEVRVDPATGRYGFTMDYWLKNHMPKKEGSLYERFMSEV